jgi:hypothetical protein
VKGSKTNQPLNASTHNWLIVDFAQVTNFHDAILQARKHGLTEGHGVNRS